MPPAPGGVAGEMLFLLHKKPDRALRCKREDAAGHKVMRTCLNK
jgi:hypothetical protein